MQILSQHGSTLLINPEYVYYVKSQKEQYEVRAVTTSGKDIFIVYT